jgi:acyl-CoA thioester hydrolase
LIPFRFYHPIEIRYADIDAQRHVNNARYFTFMEQARVKYIENLGLWAGDDFDSAGIILVQQSCTYHRPIEYGASIRVGVKIKRLGTKSLEVAYQLVGDGDSDIHAEGSTILVTYDYKKRGSIPIPQFWRDKISAFENGTDSEI